MSPYKKPCRDCGKMFQPFGKYNKFCAECLKKRIGEASRKRIEIHKLKQKEEP